MSLRVHARADVVSRSYLVAGVPCIVRASPAVIEYVDETYSAYRVEELDPQGYSLELRHDGRSLVLRDTNGNAMRCFDQGEAVLATLRRLVFHVTETLACQGIYATHAGSLVHEGAGLLLPGRSGSGKTTLTLALVGRGLGLLSDEFALSAPDARTILPYRRGLHIRPGTPELIPELAFISERPFHPLAGGFYWTLPPGDLERVFPGCLAEAAPLRHVVLLDGRGSSTRAALEPVSRGVVAVELVRGTTAAASDFTGALERVTRLVGDARCIRLRSGELEENVELLLEWLERSDG